MQAGFRKHKSHSIWIILLFYITYLKFFFTIFENVTTSFFFPLKKKACLLKDCSSISDFKGLFYLLYSMVSLLICPISFAVWQNHVMKLVKLNHNTLALLADCIKEGRVMVSQGYIRPVFLCFLKKLAKMR